ncbi:oxidoreductase NAD-binding domain-containing protein 1-like isoform X2 [Watersipora subatra]|uniref:oxidoreductase NAD-binding domain-containing protein 1-like isoform X2 n=1 Tax=Watersipora subatra TaxID=2589382 RepID=UPI00355BF005
MPTTMNKARVIAVKFLTPTVRWFKLEAPNSARQRFYAGQWLDLQIPGSDIIGGYSMCSSPMEFEKSCVFELAVKLSDHPAATWMHTECSVGMELSYRFGGEVYLDDNNSSVAGKSYLLIAGGVGINPIYSILQAIVTKTNFSLKLLYSAKTQEELMFCVSKKEINTLIESHPQLSVKYFLTEASDTDQHDAESLTFGKLEKYFDFSEYSMAANRRMNETDLQEALHGWPLDQVDSFICGPDAMITSVDTCLKRLQLSPAQIHFERWT